MRIIRAKDNVDLGRKAANLISAQMILKPDCVLGLATGSSPVSTYRQLVDWYQKGDVDFSRVRTVNLDEYVGLGVNHDQSYAQFMHQNLFDLVNINLSNTNIPNGLDPDAERECSRYDRVIRSLGGIDLQLLGLGPNGHIGFNEPCDQFVPNTHCVELSNATVDANARFFANRDAVPRRAYTMGIRDIMQSRMVVMVASGKNKAQAVKDCFFGPVTPYAPGSILQLHSNFTLVADNDALSMVEDLL